MRTIKELLPASILCITLSCCEQSTGSNGLPGVPADEHTVRLTTDWSDRGEGVDLPSHYTVRTGEWCLHEISEKTFVIPHAFQPGPHSIYIYNPAGNITVDGTTASLDVEDAYMKTSPGWFFTSAFHLTVEKGKSYSISSVMQQRIKELRFVLFAKADVADRVSYIEASFNGVASQLDIRTGDPVGWPVAVRLDFARGSDSTFVASTRIPGIIGDTQLFTCRMGFDNAGLPDLSMLYDLHDLLEDFNADRITPATVSIHPNLRN